MDSPDFHMVANFASVNRILIHLLHHYATLNTLRTVTGLTCKTGLDLLLIKINLAVGTLIFRVAFGIPNFPYPNCNQDGFSNSNGHTADASRGTPVVVYTYSVQHAQEHSSSAHLCVATGSVE